MFIGPFLIFFSLSAISQKVPFPEDIHERIRAEGDPLYFQYVKAREKRERNRKRYRSQAKKRREKREATRERVRKAFVKSRKKSDKRLEVQKRRFEKQMEKRQKRREDLRAKYAKRYRTRREKARAREQRRLEKAFPNYNPQNFITYSSSR